MMPVEDPADAGVAPSEAMAAEALIQRYTALASDILLPDVATVLHCIKEAVLDDVDPPLSAPTGSPTLVGGGEEVLHGDRAARELLLAAFDVAEHLGEAEAVRTVGGAQMQITIARRMREPLWELPRALSAGAVPALQSLAPWQVGVQQTELQSFSDFSPGDVQRARVLLAFEEMLAEVPAAAPGSFTLKDRRVSEHLPPAVLRERVSGLMRRGPEVYRRYLVGEDVLLLALHHFTPRRRRARRRWCMADAARSRRRLGRFDAPLPLGLRTPRTARVAAAAPDDPEASFERVVHTSDCFFPADHSLLFVHEDAGGARWVSAHVGDALLGLRGRTFVAELPDGSRAVAAVADPPLRKPDGFGNVVLSHTLPSGLVVEHHSRGEVTMRYASACRRSLAPGGADEVRRTVCGLGMVMVFKRAGGYEALHPDGSVTVSDDGGEMTHHSVEGGAVLRRAAGASEWTLLETRAACSYTDAATSGRVTLLPHGVSVQQLPNGDRSVVHADGTALLHRKAKNLLLVSSPGYPPVEIDLTVQRQAAKHADGERIAMSKRGKQTRLRTALSNGAAIEVSYDSRVTSKVCGAVAATHCDRSEILLAEDGSVIYRPPWLWRPPGDAALDGVASEPDATIGAYAFDLSSARLSLDDGEHNEFSISVDGFEMDLAGEQDGVAAEPLVNRPLQPALFVLHRDGSGEELLSEEAEEAFLGSVAASGGRIRRRGAAAAHGDPEDLGYEVEEFEEHLPVRCRAAGCFVGDWGQWPSAPDVPVHASPCFRRGDEQESLRELCSVRRWMRRPPMSDAGAASVAQSVAQWQRWTESRAADAVRFAVDDPRDEEQLAREALVRKRLKKVYRAARAQRRREREKACRAQEQGARLQAIEEGAGTAVQVAEDDAGDADDLDLSDSEDEVMEQGAVPDVVFLECAAAIARFSEAGDAGVPRDRLRHCVVQVTGAGLTAAEIDALLEKERGSISYGPLYNVEDLHRLVASVAGGRDASQNAGTVFDAEVRAAAERRAAAAWVAKGGGEADEESPREGGRAAETFDLGDAPRLRGASSRQALLP